jgi:large subunit ribosomal protein L21
LLSHPQLPRSPADAEKVKNAGLNGEVKIGGPIMKYAIIESGGKQYKAVEGATIEVDRLHLEEGKKLTLDSVLLISDEGEIVVGTPTVAGAKVSATVVAQFKAPKVIVFKYKSRQRYRVKQGHRQKYTRLMIDEINIKGKKKAAPAKEEKPEAEEAKPKTEATAKTTPKTKTAAKPKTKTKSKTAAKPKTKTKSKTATKPKTKTKSSTKKTGTKTSTKKSE